jgi:hypothetical protein
LLLEQLEQLVDLFFFFGVVREGAVYFLSKVFLAEGGEMIAEILTVEFHEGLFGEDDVRQFQTCYARAIQSGEAQGRSSLILAPDASAVKVVLSKVTVQHFRVVSFAIEVIGK